ncbi:MAG: VWA domain-containing protein, partial [Planctomycetota bacterium]
IQKANKKYRLFLKKIDQLLLAKEFEKAKKLIQEKMNNASKEEKKRYSQLFYEVRKKEYRFLNYWKVRKKEIEKNLTIREKWLARGLEIEELKKMLANKNEWMYRALAVSSLLELRDPRSIGAIWPALIDKKYLVRRIALDGLLDFHTEEIQQAENGEQLIQSLIQGYENCHSRLKKHYRKVFIKLFGALGKNIPTYKTWWKRNKKTWLKQYQLPFNMKKFNSTELVRYRKEQAKKILPNRSRTVIPAKEARIYLSNLKKKGIDIVVCLDVTGSMGKIIEASRKNIKDIMELLLSTVGKIRMGLVTYRDEVTQRKYFTSNWRVFRKALFQEEAFGGGDSPEGVEKAVREALKMNWRPNAHRIIMIVGDAPPHKKDMPEFLLMAHKAKKHHILFHALYAAGRTIRDIEEAVKITGGKGVKVQDPDEFAKIFLTTVFGKAMEPYILAFLRRFKKLKEQGAL